jgi:hypothetical protein
MAIVFHYNLLQNSSRDTETLQRGYMKDFILIKFKVNNSDEEDVSMIIREIAG